MTTLLRSHSPSGDYEAWQFAEFSDFGTPEWKRIQKMINGQEPRLIVSQQLGAGVGIGQLLETALRPMKSQLHRIGCNLHLVTVLQEPISYAYSARHLTSTGNLQSIFLLDGARTIAAAPQAEIEPMPKKKHAEKMRAARAVSAAHLVSQHRGPDELSSPGSSPSKTPPSPTTAATPAFPISRASTLPPTSSAVEEWSMPETRFVLQPANRSKEGAGPPPSRDWREYRSAVLQPVFLDFEDTAPYSATHNVTGDMTSVLLSFSPPRPRHWCYEQLTQDGQTCASKEGLEDLADAGECEAAVKQANQVAGFGYTMMGSVPGDVSYTVRPKGCFSACHLSNSGFFCPFFNRVEACTGTNCGVDVSEDHYVYCKRECPAPPAAPPPSLRLPASPPLALQPLLPWSQRHRRESLLPPGDEPYSPDQPHQPYFSLPPSLPSAPPPASSAAPTPPLAPEEGWHLGAEGQSCTETCASAGLSCREDDLLAHNGDVDESQRLADLIQRLAPGFNLSSCDGSYTSNVAVPTAKIGSTSKTGENNDFCAFSQPYAEGTTLEGTGRKFDCGAVPYSDGTGRQKQRICWCSARAPPSPAGPPLPLGPGTSPSPLSQPQQQQGGGDGGGGEAGGGDGGANGGADGGGEGGGGKGGGNRGGGLGGGGDSGGGDGGSEGGADGGGDGGGGDGGGLGEGGDGRGGHAGGGLGGRDGGADGGGLGGGGDGGGDGDVGDGAGADAGGGRGGSDGGADGGGLGGGGEGGGDGGGGQGGGGHNSGGEGGAKGSALGGGEGGGGDGEGGGGDSSGGGGGRDGGADGGGDGGGGDGGGGDGGGLGGGGDGGDGAGGNGGDEGGGVSGGGDGGRGDGGGDGGGGDGGGDGGNGGGANRTPSRGGGGGGGGGAKGEMTSGAGGGGGGGANELPNVAPISSTCQPWCAGHAKDWSAKCAWKKDGCSGCSECGNKEGEESSDQQQLGPQQLADVQCGNEGLQWQLSAQHQSCDAACAAAGSSCVGLPSGSRNAACVEGLASSFGRMCASTHGRTSSFAPYITSSGSCRYLHKSSSFSCSSSSSNMRFCPCDSVPPPPPLEQCPNLRKDLCGSFAAGDSIENGDRMVAWGGRILCFMMQGDVVELDENQTLVARLETGGHGHLMMHEDGSLTMHRVSSDLPEGSPDTIVFNCNRTEIDKCQTSCFGHFVAAASCELVEPFRSSAKVCVDSQEPDIEALSWPPRATKASHYLQQPQPLSLDASNRLFTGTSNLLRYFDLVGRTEALDEFAARVFLILGWHVSDWTTTSTTGPCTSTPAAMCAGPHEPCVYDAACSTPANAGDAGWRVGCNAGGVHPMCRFCGFGHYAACPTVRDDKELGAVRAHMKALSVTFPDAATIADLYEANTVDVALYNAAVLPFEPSATKKSPW